ncbi:MAG: hypothetical protein KAT15_24745, partial [Bacteroidales bacterium]|nr:hypothetical protein [Bacteroidales bacterium]
TIHEGDLYVCNRFSNTVSAIGLADFRVTGEIETAREPYSIAGSSSGLLVANHLPAGAANTGYAAAVVSVINPTPFSIESEIPLPSGSTVVKDICISADGKYAYVTHLVSRYMVPATQLDRGWMVTNAVTIIDVLNSSCLNTVLLDDVYRGAANPWGILCSSDGKYLVVSHSGTHEISIIELDTLHHNLDMISFGKPFSFSRNVEDVKHDLGFLSNCRSRVKLKGNGPRDLMKIGDRIYITEYFSGTLGVVDLADPEKVESISLAPMEEQTTCRKGEQYFHDASLCYQNWLSCSSCHPDGRNDAINWDLGNDGYGTLRQTKSLLLSHRTPPTTITGIRPDATVSVMAGFKHIEYTEVGDQIIQAVDTFLLNMMPEMSPFLVNGKLSEKAESGLGVFRKAKCISCHGGPAFTDKGLHLVGNGYSPDEKFDTPTLLETWRTGPYLHDGRAEDLKSMLVDHNRDDLHGETSNLTAKEVEDLVEYVLSISSMSPVIDNPVQDINKSRGFASDTILLEGVFSDEDSDSLWFEVDVEHPGVVNATLAGSDLILQESGP